jgi:hypothetical protein
METNGYVTAGELALWGNRCGSSETHYYGKQYSRGTTATAVALGASGLGIAIFGGLAIAYGLNAASKARARGNEQALVQTNATMQMLANVVNREATRSDGLQIDIQQTLRNQASQTATALAQGGSAASNALATAEAYALLNNSNGTGLNSAVGGCNYLRVARVSGSRLCGCGCGDSE